MKVLVIGSGGREHALVWKLSQSPLVKEIFCAPGNAGIGAIAKLVPIAVDQIFSLLQFAQKEKIDWTVVGPELPLSLGIVDQFQKEGLKIFGPSQKAAIVESSKIFTKQFCKRHHIPTADFEIFDSYEKAKTFLFHREKFPVVIKADGLAQGKGVVVAATKKESLDALEDMMQNQKLGSAGRQVVIEDFLEGEEATYMIVTDSQNYVAFDSSQDHKRIGDFDTGPNTGGMGAYSPAPIVDSLMREKIHKKIIEPTLKGLAQEERAYQGVLYAGLMIYQGEPSLIEFNCRFGDPECHALLFRLKTDLMEIIQSVDQKKINQIKINFDSKSSVCVVMASFGYPGEYSTGHEIRGLNLVNSQDVFIFHAGTDKKGAQIVTHGGRVLGVTALGENLQMAIKKAYEGISYITWNNAYFRKDIGSKGLKDES